jgi:membrane-bound lytic murein transglycosylase B
VADPHNLYDAALSAAGYLCAGGPMEGEGHLRAGFLRYNHSQAYVERVLALAYGYATVPGVPPLPPLVPAAPPPPIPSPG